MTGFLLSNNPITCWISQGDAESLLAIRRSANQCLPPAVRTAHPTRTAPSKTPTRAAAQNMALIDQAIKTCY